MQDAIVKIEKWSREAGFKLSTPKTKCIHFCRQRKCRHNPQIELGGLEIDYVEKYEYLGMILDKRLSWVPHIKHLREECLKRIGLLKCLSHLSWGTDRQTLIKVYHGVIRSKIEYGSQIYGTGNRSALKMLDCS